MSIRGVIRPLRHLPVASLGIVLFFAHAQGQEVRDSRNAAQNFAQRVERLLADLPATREHFEVRINRCENSQGNLSDTVYAVWIGSRLVANADNAAEVLDDVLADWRRQNLTITRERRLDNGGVNIAATDPANGEQFSLDSGFPPHPERYIVGHFSTPCFSEPKGSAPFGPVRQH